MEVEFLGWLYKEWLEAVGSIYTGGKKVGSSRSLLMVPDSGFFDSLGDHSKPE